MACESDNPENIGTVWPFLPNPWQYFLKFYTHCLCVVCLYVKVFLLWVDKSLKKILVWFLHLKAIHFCGLWKYLLMNNRIDQIFLISNFESFPTIKIFPIFGNFNMMAIVGPSSVLHRCDLPRFHYILYLLFSLFNTFFNIF